MEEKQIEEMAKIVAVKRGYGRDEQDHCDMSCQVFKVGCIPHEDAQILYDAGYRKQSEVDLYKRQVDELEDELVQTYDKLEAAKTEVAREIFGEIEEEIVAALESNYKFIREHNVIGNTVSESLMQRVYGKIDALRGIDDFIEELKEKYTKGGEADA